GEEHGGRQRGRCGRPQRPSHKASPAAAPSVSPVPPAPLAAAPPVPSRPASPAADSSPYFASYACRDPHTLARVQAHLRPSAVSFTTTLSPGTLCPVTTPGPSGVSTCSPCRGVLAWKSW